MALTTAYLTSTKDLESFLNALVSAQAPKSFSQAFLTKLEFTSSNHRLFIGLLKGLSFIDEAGVPTQRYYNYLDQTQSGAVLADAIRDAYGDLFAVNKNAFTLSMDEVRNKLKTLTQGQKSDDVLTKMANTFVSLCGLADWSKQAAVTPVTNMPDPNASPTVVPISSNNSGANDLSNPPLAHRIGRTQLHYNIQIHLPESRDPAVYDAIFRSLKDHLT